MVTVTEMIRIQRLNEEQKAYERKVYIAFAIVLGFVTAGLVGVTSSADFVLTSAERTIAPLLILLGFGGAGFGIYKAIWP